MERLLSLLGLLVFLGIAWALSTNRKAIKLRTIQFDIDMTQCCYCGLCTYPCPTECLVMTPEFEFVEFDKHNFLYRFAKDEPRFTDMAAPPKGKH